TTLFRSDRAADRPRGVERRRFELVVEWMRDERFVPDVALDATHLPWKVRRADEELRHATDGLRVELDLVVGCGRIERPRERAEDVGAGSTDAGRHTLLSEHAANASCRVPAYA